MSLPLADEIGVVKKWDNKIYTPIHFSLLHHTTPSFLLWG
ncbi:protein of unknown function [Vibrio tapetis subsp. tapetis]|uniref:Uncharacterized protein n=1 Tax=Vibrio tapetis subsp. tapetis TaxID=1671868 RepID=A0A2N8Z9B7_9VIBR|nr:protein of unknown function [Vibrio tapetis subsp. tapetis]